jgi:hypothetical protein
MATQLQAVGGSTFNEPAFTTKMLSYFEGFIAWVRARGKVVAKCERCQATHTFESQAHFDQFEHKCTADVGMGQECGGLLIGG